MPLEPRRLPVSPCRQKVCVERKVGGTRGGREQEHTHGRVPPWRCAVSPYTPRLPLHVLGRRSTWTEAAGMRVAQLRRRAGGSAGRAARRPTAAAARRWCDSVLSAPRTSQARWRRSLLAAPVLHSPPSGKHGHHHTFSSVCVCGATMFVFVPRTRRQLQSASARCRCLTQHTP
jgi:hypothetical protein